MSELSQAERIFGADNAEPAPANTGNVSNADKLFGGSMVTEAEAAKGVTGKARTIMGAWVEPKPSHRQAMEEAGNVATDLSAVVNEIVTAAGMEPDEASAEFGKLAGELRLEKAGVERLMDLLTIGNSRLGNCPLQKTHSRIRYRAL